MPKKALANFLSIGVKSLQWMWKGLLWAKFISHKLFNYCNMTLQKWWNVTHQSHICRVFRKIRSKLASLRERLLPQITIGHCHQGSSTRCLSWERLQGNCSSRHVQCLAGNNLIIKDTHRWEYCIAIIHDAIYRIIWKYHGNSTSWYQPIFAF